MPVGAEPTRAESEASEWLVLLESPSVPKTEIDRFQAWLAASDENKSAWASVSQTWDRLGPILASLPPEILRRQPLLPDPSRPLNTKRRPAWARPGAIAAAFAAIVLFLFAPLPFDAPNIAGATTYATQVRAGRTISLADGSTIELSPLAEVRVAFSDAERRVELLRGTALFDVTANPEAPFIVATPFGQVRVVGTSFSVRVGEESATTSVVRGVVEGSPSRGASLWSRLAPAPRSVTAHADEEIRLASREAEVRQLDAATIEQRLAWREGKVVGDNITLREAAEDVTRFSGVRFEFADRGLARERVTLLLDGSEAEGFVALLEANLGLHVERLSEDRFRVERGD